MIIIDYYVWAKLYNTFYYIKLLRKIDLYIILITINYYKQVFYIKKLSIFFF